MSEKMNWIQKLSHRKDPGRDAFDAAQKAAQEAAGKAPVQEAEADPVVVAEPEPAPEPEPPVEVAPEPEPEKPKRGRSRRR